MKTASNKNKKRNLLAIGTVVALTALIGFRLYANKTEINERSEATPQGVSAMPVKVATAELRNLDKSLRFTGSFEARKTLPLIAEAQGSITQLNIREGQSVGRGVVVARIDPTAIQSNMATATASYNNAVKNRERYERLVEAGAISQKQYEDVALNVENARANLTGIQQQMKYTVVNSPMSGIIGEVKVEQGSFATMGMQIGTVVDISSLKMVVKVPEEDVIKLKKGQPVSILTDVYPDHTFKGNITLVSVQADAGRKYDVEVEVKNDSSFPLKAGMFGTAALQQLHVFRTLYGTSACCNNSSVTFRQIRQRARFRCAERILAFRKESLDCTLLTLFEDSISIIKRQLQTFRHALAKCAFAAARHTNQHDIFHIFCSKSCMILTISSLSYFPPCQIS